MGERRARWGYGYQDKVATERILDVLREEIRGRTSDFECVRLADLEAGRVDDFVLVWRDRVEGNSIKWGEHLSPVNWEDLVGENGLLRGLADGCRRLASTWSGRDVSVRMHTNRPPSTTTHHSSLVPSISVAAFLETGWARGPSGGGDSRAWERISEHTGLTGVELQDFGARCELALGCPQPPQGGDGSIDVHRYHDQFDRLHKAIATWITNNPGRETFSRDELLAAIGFSSHRSGLVQRFPEPQIPYQPNARSAAELRSLIDATPGGYLAVTGPAGIGKSTLVQEVLKDHPFFIPYYAYLPEGEGNPRDRGEALTFFQDVVGRLDGFSQHRTSLGVTDVAHGRESLKTHMARAREKRLAGGAKTILLVDGLDHVTREPGLDRPLQRELPLPIEVPDGFLIILSCQPQALDPALVASEVAHEVEEGSGRRMEVRGLTRDEVYSILAKAADSSSGSERDQVFDACQGNPLILTYILRLLDTQSVASVDEAIELAGSYSGDIEGYYHAHLDSVFAGEETRQLLGLLSRAVQPVPVSWLQGWPEYPRLEEMYRRSLKAFLYIDGGYLRFLHNSLASFLEAMSRTQIPGADHVLEEHRFHAVLADRCGGAACSEHLGRAKAYHLSRAGRPHELISLLSSAWLREGLGAFVPYAVLRPLLVAGLSAAWELQDLASVVRLVLLDHELDQRSARLTPADLADRFLRLGDPTMALTQINANGRLLADSAAVLRLARRLWEFARDTDQDALLSKSRQVYDRAKPIALLLGHEPVDTAPHSDDYQTLGAWVEAAPLYESVNDLLERVGPLRFKKSISQDEVDDGVVKASLLYRALRTLTDGCGPPQECETLVDTICTLDQGALAVAAVLRLVRYRVASGTDTGPLLDKLEKLVEATESNGDLVLACAEALYRAGRREAARVLVSRVPHLRFDAVVGRHHSLGFTDVSYTVLLSFLQVALGVDTGVVPGVVDEDDEAVARAETAAREIGVLEARAALGEKVPDLRARFRSLLLFHNRGIGFDVTRSGKAYALAQARPEVYEALLVAARRLGRVGPRELSAAVWGVLESPAGVQFAPAHRRLLAQGLFECGGLNPADAIRLGMSSIVDAEEEEPEAREAACFDIAIFLHGMGAEQEAREWVTRAGTASAGAGGHKDYHMASLADWLGRSLVGELDERSVPLLDRFARAVEVAGGAGGSTAAQRLLVRVFVLHPAKGSNLAIELVDRGVLGLASALSALVIGGAQAGANPSVVAAVYTELLSLIAVRATEDAAVAAVRRHPLALRTRAAAEIMAAVRANSVPSARAPVARDLEDALLADGLGTASLTTGLPPGHDDSSSSSFLYRLDDGSLLTVAQLAARLSDPKATHTWNPNPDANPYFSWWHAVRLAEVRSAEHLNDLLTVIPTPEYRTAAVHAWKASSYLRLGDQAQALDCARYALEVAHDGSWFEWLDGAQLRVAFDALMAAGDPSALPGARARFGGDLGSGKLHNRFLLDDLPSILDSLELEWPAEGARAALDDYLAAVLGANRTVSAYSSITEPASQASPDEALCRFLATLLAFPVIDVGVGARRVLSRYATEDGRGLVALLQSNVLCDPVQLEHLLASVDVGCRAGNRRFEALESHIVALNRHESIGVRAVARRIAETMGWEWSEIRDMPQASSCLCLPTRARAARDYEEARMLVGSDHHVAAGLYRWLLEWLADFGRDPDEVRSEYLRVFERVKGEYRWGDEPRLNRWVASTSTQQWVKPRVIIGREAVMRAFGRSALRDEAPEGGEVAYDLMAPIYDRDLELQHPVERPAGFAALCWRFGGEDATSWLAGEQADEWRFYPYGLGELVILGERTWFIRPEWNWPREERYRGLTRDTSGLESSHRLLWTTTAVTFEAYLRGFGQGDEALIVLNHERQLFAAASKWAAFNANAARTLGWTASRADPFTWMDASGDVMVRSLWWRDGWTWLKPPTFETLGEGWVVLASQKAIRAIQHAYPSAEQHLWVERHSHGSDEKHMSWHLRRGVSRELLDATYHTPQQRYW